MDSACGIKQDSRQDNIFSIYRFRVSFAVLTALFLPVTSTTSLWLQVRQQAGRQSGANTKASSRARAMPRSCVCASAGCPVHTVPHWLHHCHTSQHFFGLVTLFGGVISCCTRRYLGEIWAMIQPRALSQAACLKLGGDMLLHDWSICKSLYIL